MNIDLKDWADLEGLTLEPGLCPEDECEGPGDNWDFVDTHWARDIEGNVLSIWKYAGLRPDINPPFLAVLEDQGGSDE